MMDEYKEKYNDDPKGVVTRTTIQVDTEFSDMGEYYDVDIAFEFTQRERPYTVLGGIQDEWVYLQGSAKFSDDNLNVFTVYITPNLERTYGFQAHVVAKGIGEAVEMVLESYHADQFRIEPGDIEDILMDDYDYYDVGVHTRIKI
tara:strand:+ start:558 stop:992 length:435 start_codon:yes stop_codon:yes gene_type:complete